MNVKLSKSNNHAIKSHYFKSNNNKDKQNRKKMGGDLEEFYFRH